MPALFTQIDMLPIDLSKPDTLLLARAIDAGMGLAEQQNKTRNDDKPHIIPTGKAK